ncbi:MAG: hypothetical protein RLZZ387_631 [Chloroflexota bacterium]|jgi:uncharacterized protein (TIGR02271 family)
MATNVVGLFDSWNEAQRAVQDLMDSGIRQNDISIVANDAEGNLRQHHAGGTEAEEGLAAGAVGGGVLGGVLGLLAGVGALAIPGIGPVIAAGPLAAALGSAGAGAVVGAGAGAVGGGLLGGLVGLGIPEDDAHLYAEGIRRGGALVTVRTSENRVEPIAAIMQRHGVIDIDDRSAEWRSSGWSRFDENSKPYTRNEINTFRSSRSANTIGTTNRSTGARDVSARNQRRSTGGEETLPVIEEELQVGKRQVQRGGVRVHTKVEERPVEEQVNLRDERVRVERRPVDRPVGADMNVFKETSFEMTETAEEAVVQKRARVIEEVVVRKDVEDHTETIRDTVRRQDVHVHEEGTTERAVGSRAFDTYDNDYRTHFTSSMGSSGYSYDQYRPVYRYGYDLANDRRYTGKDWNAIESDARRSWEERNPNSWDEFKDSVRYAWERARGKR